MASGSTSFIVYDPPGNGGAPEKAYILLHGSAPRWLAANQTALDIARGLDAGLSLEEMAAGLAARFGLEQEAAQRDVEYVAARLKERGLVRNKTEPGYPSPALETLYLHLTARCNLACPHCYLACPGPADLPTSLVLRGLDELQEAGGASVTLSGGEPLLHPDIRKILQYAACRVGVELLSNGTLIDQNTASFLAGEVNPEIQISLDGSTAVIHDSIRGEGSFFKTLQALDFLKEAGLSGKITLAATIMRPNLDDLPAIIALAQALGISRVRFLPLRPVGRARERWLSLGYGLGSDDYHQFFDYVSGLRDSRSPGVEVSCGLSGFLLEMPESGGPADYWCPVGRQLIVDVAGAVFPCVLMMQPEFSLGHISQGSLIEMMQSETLASAVEALAERREKIETCSGCTWRNLCQSGCMGQALDETGTVWSPDSFCGYRQKAYQEAFARILADFGRPRPQ